MSLSAQVEDKEGILQGILQLVWKMNYSSSESDLKNRELFLEKTRWLL